MDDLTKEFLAESLEGLERMERSLTELESRPADAELLSEIFRAVHTIKGSTGFLGYTRLERLAHAGEHLLGGLRDDRLQASPAVITVLLALLDRLRHIVLLIERTGHEGTRVLDEDSDLILQLEACEHAASHVGGEPHAGAAPGPDAAEEAVLSVPVPLADASGGNAANSIADKTLRVEVAVLNRMINLVGELVLTRNQILQAESAALPPTLATRLDMVTAELRETVMQARLQPVGVLFGRFPRMVRDLARTCGRLVRVEVEGQDTGLDKSLLEAIKDPLAHALRNAVDHGIEPPDERVRRGKPVEGVIRLRAHQQNGFVVIEMTDDGGGIARTRVLARALERGLIAPERAAALAAAPEARETWELLFAPGFSTAENVTRISGRGVGMDVVRSNVERVGGTVELESVEGQGTTLRLRVPLTLAIVPAIVVRSGGMSFCLPQNALEELVYVPRREAAAAVERMGAAELFHLRGTLLPMVWLDDLLELPHAREAHGFYLAVLEVEGARYGLAIDDLLPPEEIVVKPLSATLRTIGVYGGATVLGCGTLAMILDAHAVAVRAGVRAQTRAAQTEEPAAPAPRPSYLIFECLEPVLAGPQPLAPQPLAPQPLAPVRARCERMAIPLAWVERIESIPAGTLEYAGGKALLQYRGGLLPVEDRGGKLRTAAAAEEIALLICQPPGEASRVGLVVESVLDVAHAETEAGVLEAGGVEVTVLRDRITRLGAPARQPRPAALEEVA